MDKPVKILQIVGSMHPGGNREFCNESLCSISIGNNFPSILLCISSRQEIIQRESKSSGGTSYLLFTTDT